MVQLEKMTDAQLLASAASGNERAFKVLFDRHVREIRWRANDVLHNRLLAEEAVQDAFLDLWRTATSYNEARASVRTWLCVLVHRRAVDLARHEARRARPLPWAGNLEPSSYTAEETLLLRLEQREVQVALGGLSQHSRELLELAYYGGLTHSQLAERFQIPLGTVKSRMRQALSDLSALFGPSATKPAMAKS